MSLNLAIKGAEDHLTHISGIDTYGSIRTTSRSDVNIIATVNPRLRRSRLQTPRIIMYLPYIRGMRDKLTHAGVYGIDVSIGTGGYTILI